MVVRWPVSQTHLLYKCLRGKSNKAVWGEHSQRNHYLAPLVAGSHIYEPWLIVFKKRWQTLRRIWVSVPDFAAKWNYFVGVSVSKGMGPLSLFLLDLRFLGWEPQAHGRVALPEGDTLHVYFSNWSLVWGKLLRAWETHVCAQVQSCKGLLGLEGFSVVRVRSRLETKHGYNAHVANYACGAIVPAQRRKHFTCDEDLKCPFCDGLLTTEHMLLSCPATAPCREGLLETLRCCDPFEVQWGLFKIPQEVKEFHTALRQLQWAEVHELFDEDVHLFTDGSTICPENPCLSLSA